MLGLPDLAKFIKKRFICVQPVRIRADATLARNIDSGSPATPVCSEKNVLQKGWKCESEPVTETRSQSKNCDNSDGWKRIHPVEGGTSGKT